MPVSSSVYSSILMLRRRFPSRFGASRRASFWIARASFKASSCGPGLLAMSRSARGSLGRPSTFTAASSCWDLAARQRLETVLDLLVGGTLRFGHRPVQPLVQLPHPAVRGADLVALLLVPAALGESAV